MLGERQTQFDPKLQTSRARQSREFCPDERVAAFMIARGIVITEC